MEIIKAIYDLTVLDVHERVAPPLILVLIGGAVDFVGEGVVGPRLEVLVPKADAAPHDQGAIAELEGYIFNAYRSDQGAIAEL